MRQQFLTATLLAAVSTPVAAARQEHAVEDAERPGTINAQIVDLDDELLIADQDGRRLIVKAPHGVDGAEQVELHIFEGAVEIGPDGEIKNLNAGQPLQLGIQQRKMVEAAYLGINAEPLALKSAKQLGVPRGTGLMISFVAPDSPAAAVGLMKGDVLTKLNDQVLVNAEQFAVLIRTHQGGDTVTLHALREGEPIEFKAELDQREVPQLGPGGRNLDRAWRVQQQRPVNPFDLVVPGQLQPGQLEVIPQLDDRMPEELREIMRKVQEQMQQQREQIERRMQQMRLELDLDLNELRGQLEPLPGQVDGEHRVQASMMVADGEHTLQLKTNGDAKHLTVKTADGEVLFDGEVPEGGKIEGLDPEVQQKIDSLLNNKIEARTIDIG